MVMAQLMDEEVMTRHMEEWAVMDLLIAHGSSYRGHGSSFVAAMALLVVAAMTLHTTDAMRSVGSA